jgi:hypothetical protein
MEVESETMPVPAGTTTDAPETTAAQGLETQATALKNDESTPPLTSPSTTASTVAASTPTSPVAVVGVSGVKAEITGHDTKDSVTFYKIVSTKEEDSAECLRRYTEFMNLHTALRSRFPTVAEYVPPSKAYWNTQTPETKQHRMQRFAEFLNILTNLGSELPAEAAAFLKLNVPVRNQLSLKICVIYIYL